MTGQLDALAARVAEHYGLQPRDAWRSDLQTVASELCSRLSCSHDSLVPQVVGNDALLREVAGRLTVGETFFLRHPEQFEFLTRAVGERLADPLGGTVKIRSAGCASGEEPYSVVIALQETLPAGWADRVVVTATDVSSEAIERAKRAHYTAWSFRSAPPGFCERYFRTTTEMIVQYSLREEIRRLVRFECSGIEQVIDATATDSVDVILFRNVGIYLRPDALERIFAGMHRVLRRSGGYLIVAPSDPAPPRSHFRPVGEPVGVLRAVDPATSLRPPKPQAFAPRPEFPAGAARVRSEPRYATVSPADSSAGSSGRKPVQRPRAEATRPVRKAATPAPALARANGGGTSPRASAASARPEAPLAQPRIDDLLRNGRLALAALRTETAVAELRRAVFLDGTHKLARFWYANALAAAGASRQALNQLREVLAQLQALPADATIEDGTSTVGELLQGVSFLMEGME